MDVEKELRKHKRLVKMVNTTLVIGAMLVPFVNDQIHIIFASSLVANVVWIWFE